MSKCEAAETCREECERLTRDMPEVVCPCREPVIWSARHWGPMLSIAEHLGDRESVRILTEHALYADHCGGYDVLAWPCPIAADTLTYLREETP